MSKKRILSVAIIMILLLVCITNSKVFASSNIITTIDAGTTTGADTSGTGASTITITNKSTGLNVISGNTTQNAVGANTVTGNIAVNQISGTNTVNSVSNNAVSSYNRVSNSAGSNLPYTGSNSSLMFVVIAFIASAIYAYKKVRDYNV